MICIYLLSCSCETKRRAISIHAMHNEDSFVLAALSLAALTQQKTLCGQYGIFKISPYTNSKPD